MFQIQVVDFNEIYILCHITFEQQAIFKKLCKVRL